MASLRERIARARETLIGAGIPAANAALDADLLARHALGWDRARLVADGRDRAPAGFDAAYDPLVARRATREPIAYIIGHREFWGLDFEVTPDVLIPRPETEFIVEEALAAYRDAQPGLIVDIGTGSGCLAIALALEFPNAELIATDVSLAALNVARRNAVRHGVTPRIAFVQTDLMPRSSKINLIVSNPPYVPLPDAPTLAPDVRAYEPRIALYADADGLGVYRRLLPETHGYATRAENTRLIVEVGYDQDAAVTALAVAAGWTLERARQDLQGITRTLVFRCEWPEEDERSEEGDADDEE
ncbi:MAG TPA: peptide chain release factor N(5)-glutamine methyltransferase [Vicinamibacterales bacterium]